MRTGVPWITLIFTLLIFTLFVGDVLISGAVAIELAQNSDAARRQAEEAQRRQADEQRRQAEEAQRRHAEEQRRQAEESQRRQAEEQRRHAEESQRRQAAEEQRRHSEDSQRRQADEQRRRAEEAQHRQGEEQRRQAEGQRRQAEEAQRRQADEQRRRAGEAQPRQGGEPPAGEAQPRQPAERPAEAAQPRQPGERPAEGAQRLQAGEAQGQQAEEQRRQAEEEEILRTRYGCIIAERLVDSRLRLVCGARSIIVRCSTIECPEAAAELSRLAQEELSRQEERALVRVHGCKIIARLGARHFNLACGSRRITVVCSTLECPEAGAELRRLSTEAARTPAEGSAVASATVNLRSGLGTDSEILATIPAGSTVSVGTCDTEWCAVTWNGQNGYAIARNLDLRGSHRAGVYLRQPRYRLPRYAPGPGYYYGPPLAYGPAYYYGPRVYYRPWGWRRGVYYRPGWGWRRHWW
jgi:uncharacterized protein YraI